VTEPKLHENDIYIIIYFRRLRNYIYFAFGYFVGFSQSKTIQGKIDAPDPMSQKRRPSKL